MAVEWLPVVAVSSLSHPAGTLGTLCRRATELHSRAAMNEQVPSPLRRGSARETRESLWSAPPLCGGTGRPTLLASAPGSPTSRKHHGWARMPLRMSSLCPCLLRSPNRKQTRTSSTEAEARDGPAAFRARGLKKFERPGLGQSHLIDPSVHAQSLAPMHAPPPS